MSHSLPKQQTLLDCFLEAQAKRTRRRRSGGGAVSVALPADQAEGPAAADGADQPIGLKPVQLT
jgi:hypothetical protein